ncbi:AraC-like DNA-binding protein [Nocardioides zeae]|uniref:AraC-like DNA-binding protein n=2 Tax=Nocardioides zeae TaxID=1457234 RepID=A0ACC6IMJ0_9ACTN|nr:helix-turn-helix domain-containing protein [Nocardioides zeae]MDQ1102934.1 AraC-like DNA-binding protein [Nocardioides zeae]MDR6173331.1 AraC-like DNA-binding protein [Nocardioides zeae]MDR6211971.1 AraC-like DNA-binding protein [Nocardioides zeae]
MRTWTTLDRPEADQYSYWREVVCEAFTPLRPAERGHADRWCRGGLPGWVASRSLGAVNAAEVASCDQVIHHGRREVGRVEQEVAFVNVMLGGRCVVEQDGRRTLSGPGTFSVVDATRPFRLDYLDEWRTLSFRVPVGAVPSAVPSAVLAPATAVTFSARHGLSSVLASTLDAIWRNEERLGPDEAESAGAAVTTLLLALGPSADGAGPAALDGPAAATALRHRIEDHVRLHVADADVTPPAVAAHFGISLRKLHQLYAGTDASFGQTVMRIRVEQCAEDLVRRGGAGSLTALAHRWGFADLSHLNKAFRRHVGCRAAEYAEAALSPVDRGTCRLDHQH